MLTQGCVFVGTLDWSAEPAPGGPSDWSAEPAAAAAGAWEATATGSGWD